MLYKNKILVVTLICCILTPLAAISATASESLSQQKPTNPIPIIIDTDMAIDDWFAILYLAKSKNAEIKGIAVTGTGEATCKAGVDNALKLLNLAAVKGVPVACGRSTTYPGGHPFPDLWREQADSMLDIKLAPAPEKPFNGDAIELYHKILNKYPATTIVALGPLTNLADLFMHSPSYKQRIKMLYYMGGAVRVPGNVNESVPSLENKVAEWNAYVDPVAMHQVFTSQIPITLIPLDATNQAPLTEEFYKKFKENSKTKVANFIAEVLNKRTLYIHPEGWFFWDPLAAAAAVDESFVNIETLKIKVILGPDAIAGQTIEHISGNNIRVATTANGERFADDFIKTLNLP